MTIRSFVLLLLLCPCFAMGRFWTPKPPQPKRAGWSRKDFFLFPGEANQMRRYLQLKYADLPSSLEDETSVASAPKFQIQEKKADECAGTLPKLVNDQEEETCYRQGPAVVLCREGYTQGLLKTVTKHPIEATLAKELDFTGTFSLEGFSCHCMQATLLGKNCCEN